MGAARILSHASLHRRLTQNILVCAVLSLSAILFFASLTAIISLQGSLQGMIDSLHAGHIVIFGDRRADDPQQIARWFENREEIEVVSPVMPYKQTNETLSFKGREITSWLYLVERLQGDYGIDDLVIMQGGKDEDGNLLDRPRQDEIWLPVKFALTAGITVGDKLGIPTPSGRYELTVSALVIDPLYNSGLVNPTRSWVGPGQLAFMFPVFNLQEYHLSVRLHDTQAISAIKAAVFNELAFSGIILPVDILVGVYSMQFSIMGGALFAGSLLALLAALFFIMSTIRSAIHSEYRSIGMLKASGFTKHEFLKAFLLQYLLICAVALLPAIAVGWLLLQAIGASFVDSVGVMFVNYPVGITIVITVGVFVLCTVLVVMRAAAHAGRVNTIQAIQYGVPPQTVLRRRMRSDIGLTRFTISLFVGLRFVFQNKSKLVAGIVTVVFVVISVLAPMSFLNSISQGLENPALWGAVSGDVNVTLTSRRFALTHERFTKILDKDPAVRFYLPYSWTVALIPGQANEAPAEIVGTFYQGDMMKGGLPYWQGRAPETNSEIAIGQNTAATYNKKVGDSFELFIEGQHSLFTVVGIYQCMNNFGQGFQLQYSALEALNPIIKPTNYIIFLEYGTGHIEFRDTLEKRYGEALDAKTGEEMMEQFQPVIVAVTGTILFIALVFFIVLAAVVFSHTLMSVREFSRSLGLLKTMGFSPIQLRLALVWKSLIIAGIGLVIGIPLAIALGPVVLGAVGGMMGGFQFNYILHIWQILLVTIILVMVSGLSTWISSGRIRKINPRILVKE